MIWAFIGGQSPFLLSSCITGFFCLFPQCCHCSQPLFRSVTAASSFPLPSPLSVYLWSPPHSLAEPCGHGHAPLTLFCGCCCCHTCWRPSDHNSRVSDKNGSLSGHTPCTRLFVWPLLLPLCCTCAQNICKSEQQHSSSVGWRIVLSVFLDDWTPDWNRADPGAHLCLPVLGAPACHAAWDTPVHRKQNTKHSPKDTSSGGYIPLRIQNPSPKLRAEFMRQREGLGGGVRWGWNDAETMRRVSSIIGVKVDTEKCEIS